MRTRLFLRTAEFLWQEGHTAHATEQEALAETRQMLDVYAEFAEKHMAMPVIQGEKTAAERFPGAVSTLAIEAMMQDRKALQAGTSHFLGQNFSRVQEIQFQDQNGEQQYAWTTSWGVSTRLIGALIMVHSDDDGLVLPPRLAPKQVVLLPIYRNDDERSKVMGYCRDLQQQLSAQNYSGEPVEVLLDDRDLRGGEKNWYHVKRGVPVRVEVGPRDMAADQVFVSQRTTGKEGGQPRAEFVNTIASRLENIQDDLFQRALQLREQNTQRIDSLDDFRDFFTTEDRSESDIHGGFALCHYSDEPALEAEIKKLKVTIRCVPLKGEEEPGTCIVTGKPSSQRAVFGKSY
ncbi:MAG: proline--tRNA ligase [Planctomycetaceae bacterium]|nr:proline--tRNA ligase [Planctomycetaceae bacterium]